MSHGFNDYGNKNTELLRHHLRNDIADLKNLLTKKTNDYLGYIFASLIDVLIVAVTSHELVNKSITYVVKYILILVVIFVVVNIAHNKIINYKKTIKEVSGKITEEDRIKNIDDFDNIAFDSILISLEFMEKYRKEEEPVKKDFCFYETFHYFTKALRKFDTINNNINLYVRITATDDSNLIDSYRYNNFIEFVNIIYKFVDDEIESGRYQYDLIQTDMINIDSKMKAYKMLQVCNPTSGSKGVN